MCPPWQLLQQQHLWRWRRQRSRQSAWRAPRALGPRQGRHQGQTSLLRPACRELASPHCLVLCLLDSLMARVRQTALWGARQQQAQQQGMATRALLSAAGRRRKQRQRRQQRQQGTAELRYRKVGRLLPLLLLPVRLAGTRHAEARGSSLAAITNLHA